MTEAWLAWDALRIDAPDGAELLSAEPFAAQREHVVLVGEVSAWFRLALGRARLARGAAWCLGRPLSEAVTGGWLGVALDRPGFDPSATVLDLLSLGARLAGHRPRAARQVAEAALAELGLARWRGQRLGAAGLSEHRALAALQASLPTPEGGPLALAVEAPFEGLGPEEAERHAALLMSLSRGRRLLWSCARPPTSGAPRALYERAQDVCWVREGTLSVTPPSAQLTRWRATVLERGAALERWLREAGQAVRLHRAPESPNGPAVLELYLPSGARPALLFEGSVATRAPIVELTAS